MNIIPLHNAVRVNDFHQVELHSRNGDLINVCDQDDRNALQIAVIQNPQNRDIIELLLERGAHVTARNIIHGNALVQAVGGSLEIMGLLLDRAIFQDDYIRSAGHSLARAAGNGDLGAVRFLLSRGVRPSPDGCILHKAVSAYHNSEELVRVLLEAGADVNAQGGYHGTALQAAVKYGKTDIRQMLLEAGANV